MCLISVCGLCSEVNTHGGIELVITLVKAEQAALVECAIVVLINMSKVEELSDVIVDSGIIPALIQALSFQLVLCPLSQFSSILRSGL